jgi:hypothetical protein
VLSSRYYYPCKHRLCDTLQHAHVKPPITPLCSPPYTCRQSQAKIPPTTPSPSDITPYQIVLRPRRYGRQHLGHDHAAGAAGCGSVQRCPSWCKWPSSEPQQRRRCPRRFVAACYASHELAYTLAVLDWCWPNRNRVGHRRQCVPVWLVQLVNCAWPDPLTEGMSAERASCIRS